MPEDHMDLVVNPRRADGKLLAVPRLNVGGTAPQQLVESIHGAIVGVRHARAALSGASPNGRDFLAAEFVAAVAQAEERDKLLERVESELQLIIESIYAQDSQRRAMRGGRS